MLLFRSIRLLLIAGCALAALSAAEAEDHPAYIPMKEVSGNVFKRPSARTEKGGTGTGGTKDALGKYDEALKYAPNWKQLKLAHESIAKQKVWPRIRKTRRSRPTAKGHHGPLDARPW